MLRFSEQIISHGFFLHRIEGKAKRIQSKISKNVFSKLLQLQCFVRN